MNKGCQIIGVGRRTSSFIIGTTSANVNDLSCLRGKKAIELPTECRINGLVFRSAGRKQKNRPAPLQSKKKGLKNRFTS
jgi:hypothetical protein